MAIFKCKICGGTLEFSEGSSVCECQYCGTRQTLPQISGEHSTTLYERADHFRRNNDFDKAISIYEQILNENNTDAEAYWSLVLCRYGVEYVEDPKSNKRIATVNRMQYTSVLADEDYKSAIKYADPAQKEIYETEAKEIDSIQKGILAISQKEEPFDVFICYKETDNSGRRTPDSVLANELYHQLDNEGFKVFFSRITLEDKLGTAYEPYIFAALNSAKVMVVIGTKPEYFNAVWVRNEWSRFLALIKNGANKVLIPAYRDMDPYDLPEEFSHLQAQDMSKLGFMQDLIRGIEKLTSASKPKQVKEQPVQSGANTAPLLRRAFLFLEDGDWASADEYCEKVLDLDPESGEAYLGKMMSELKIRRRELLPEQEERFDNNPQYKKVLRFGSAQLQEELKSATKAINERAERKRLSIAYKKAASLFTGAKAKEDYLAAAEAFDAIGDFEDAKERAKACREKYDEVYYGGLYTAAVAAMGYAKSEEDFVKAGKAFDKIKDYKDSAKLSAECVTKAEYTRKNAIYTEAIACMTGSKVQNYKKAISKFEKIRDFKDSERKIEWCNQKIEQINEAILAADIAKQNRAQARAEALQAGASAIKEKLPLIKKIALVVVPVLVIAIVASLVLPKISFKKEPVADTSISDNITNTDTTEDSAASTTDTTETTDTTDTAETTGTTGTTDTTENQKPQTQTPSTQKPTTQQPSTQKPSTQTPSTQQPSTNIPSIDIKHAKDCPFANGAHAEIFSCEKGNDSFECRRSTGPSGQRVWIHNRIEGTVMYRYVYDINTKQIEYHENRYASKIIQEDMTKWIYISYNSDGSVNRSVEVDYVSNFTVEYGYKNEKVVTKIENKTDVSGNCTETLYRYNETGNIVYKVERSMNSASTPVDGREYQYDEDGKLLYYTAHEFKSSTESVMTIYSPQNAIICKTYINKSNAAAGTCDADGKYFSDWSNRTCIFESYDSSGNIIIQVFIEGGAIGLVPWIVYNQYDANGNLISRQETDYWGIYLNSVGQKTYDSKGEIVKEQSYQFDVSWNA